MTAVPETKYAKSGDFHIAYQVIGTGPFDLVFMHGWISHICPVFFKRDKIEKLSESFIFGPHRSLFEKSGCRR